MGNICSTCDGRPEVERTAWDGVVAPKENPSWRRKDLEVVVASPFINSKAERAARGFVDDQKFDRVADCITRSFGGTADAAPEGISDWLLGPTL